MTNSDTTLKEYWIIFVLSVFSITLISISISTAVAYSDQRKTDTPLSTLDESAAAKWSSLLQRKPYPYISPLPPEERTILDGTYTKFDTKKQPQVPCRRCPDYVPEGGIWKLQFDKGVFRIFHVNSGWKSIGSFQVKGNRLSLFNDPVCHELTGVYAWTLKDNQLTLKVIKDACKIRLRAKNLTKQSWLSCSPPNREAAISGHWPEPPSCQ